MEHAALGRSGLTTSRLGLGLAALGRPGYINLGHGEDLVDRSVGAMEAHAHRMLDAAYRMGITYVDAARSYGRAEEFLATWLEATKPDITVGSKWGYTYTAGWRVDAEQHEVKDHGVAAFERQIVESQHVLGDALRLYQIHSATPETGVLEDAAVLSRLSRLREDGIAVGLSTSGPHQSTVIRQAIAVVVDGVPLFDAVQATWNLLETSAAPALREAADAGMGVIVKEAVANGRLTARNEHVSGLLPGAVAPDSLAIAAALMQPWCHVVLSGAATIDQLHSNATALAIEQEWVADLPDLAEPPGEYWARRRALPWT
ncbi:MAG TPA: aldo/keto reductase [Acidimicrobiia bacterium]|nr:aldo/keto reductase [Acidimicrobiia bacterium]